MNKNSKPSGQMSKLQSLLRYLSHYFRCQLLKIEQAILLEIMKKQQSLDSKDKLRL